MENQIFDLEIKSQGQTLHKILNWGYHLRICIYLHTKYEWSTYLLKKIVVWAHSDLIFEEIAESAFFGY